MESEFSVHNATNCRPAFTFSSMKQADASLLSFIGPEEVRNIISEERQANAKNPEAHEQRLFKRLGELGGAVSCRPISGYRVRIRTTRLDPFQDDLMLAFGDIVHDFALLQHCLLELRRKRLVSWRSYYEQNRLVIALTKTALVAMKTKEIER